MKNSIAVISNRLDQTEEIIYELEYRSFEIIHSEDNLKKKKTNEENLWASWDIIKRNNLYVIGFPEREDREEGTEKLI